MQYASLAKGRWMSLYIGLHMPSSNHYTPIIMSRPIGVEPK